MTEKDSMETIVTKDDEEKKKPKKEKKRKRDNSKDEVTEGRSDISAATNSKSASLRKELLKQRRLEREKLLDKVPKVDDNGISYTKQQIRLMRKRVQKGLHPVETPAEKHARLVHEAQLRKEVEAELAGVNDNEDVDDHAENFDGANNGGGDDADDADDDDIDIDKSVERRETNINNTVSPDEGPIDGDGDDDNDYSYEKRPDDAFERKVDQSMVRPIKKKKRAKPVPPDYICSACKNESDQPAHWIYDCSYKKTIPGTNQVSRKKRGLNDPLETKLFVSGLPFETTVQDVNDMFMTKANNAIVTHCKLIKFNDTKRCKGQAYVTFATPDAAKNALRLNGTILTPTIKQNKNDNNQNRTNTTKELKLKITKVLNRAMTKMKQKSN
jgi:RNA recognition motif. (a.k.a. RRM, RBD, or RNP domain)